MLSQIPRSGYGRNSAPRALWLLFATVMITAMAAACGSTADGDSGVDSDGSDQSAADTADPAEDEAATDQADDADAGTAEEGDTEADEPEDEGSADHNAPDPTTTTTIATDPEWIGSAKAEAASIALADALVHPCTPSPSDSPLTKDLDTAPKEIAAGLIEMDEAMDALAASCDESVEAFDSALSDAIDSVSSFASAQLDEAPELTLRSGSPAEKVASAMIAYEWAAWTLAGQAPIGAHQNALWLNYVHRGHALRVARTTATNAATGPTLVTGAAPVQYAVDDGTREGREILNTALPGGTPGTIEAWLERIRTQVATDSVILGISATDFVRATTDGCALNPTSDFAELSSRTEAMFTDAPGIGTTELRDLTASETAGQLLLLSPLAVPYAEDFEGGGDFVRYPNLGQPAVELRNERVSAIFDSWQVCGSLIEEFASMTQALIADGVEVTVAFMPIHSKLRAQAPADGAGLGVLQDRVLRNIGEGPTVLNLTESVPDDEFIDFILLDENGAATTSGLLDIVAG